MIVKLFLITLIAICYTYPNRFNCCRSYATSHDIKGAVGGRGNGVNGGDGEEDGK